MKSAPTVTTDAADTATLFVVARKYLKFRRDDIVTRSEINNHLDQICFPGLRAAEVRRALEAGVLIDASDLDE